MIGRASSDVDEGARGACSVHGRGDGVGLAKVGLNARVVAGFLGCGGEAWDGFRGVAHGEPDFGAMLVGGLGGDGANVACWTEDDYGGHFGAIDGVCGGGL